MCFIRHLKARPGARAKGPEGRTGSGDLESHPFFPVLGLVQESRPHLKALLRVL